MSWILVTGGVASGIGKGCLASVAGRLLSRAGRTVDYRKVEPCFQGEIAAMPNTAFGEVVRFEPGNSVDGDIARAAFLIPGFVPDAQSDLSLGRILRRACDAAWPALSPAPRL